MQKIHRYFWFASRTIVGIVFIYSGFVKAVDPLGSVYKFTDYFNAFHMPWAQGLAPLMGMALSTLELLIGIALLLNLKPKLANWGALLLMAFFTPLTFVLALTNPVHDCGCFGDALILTNWQTFWKNIFLDVPVIFLFINRRNYPSPLRGVEQWAALVISTFTILGTSFYSLNHLPLLDFRPYKVGTFIPDGMIILDGAPADVWESNFIYKKEGIQKEFSLNQLPDSTWTFVDSKHTLVKKGYEPPIHDFTITDADGIDQTDQLLSSPEYNFVVISYNLSKSNQAVQPKINELYNYCLSQGKPFYALTASGDETIETFKNETGAEYTFFATDEITLKTVIRANPGILLVKEGVIIDKWNARDFPNIDKLHANLTHQSLQKYKNQTDKYYIYTLVLGAALFIAIYLLIRNNYNYLVPKND